MWKVVRNSNVHAGKEYRPLNLTARIDRAPQLPPEHPPIISLIGGVRNQYAVLTY